MENGFTLTKPMPKKKANILSKLTFVWLIKLFYKGTKKSLAVGDLYQPMASDKSKKLTDKLEINWNIELEKAKEEGREPKLLKAITATFFWNYMGYGLIIFFYYGILKSILPAILSIFIRLFMSEKENEHLERDKWLYGGIIVGLSFFIIFFTHHTNLATQRIGMKIRISCCSLLYRKLLRLNKKSLGQTAAGQLVNLLSNDVTRFDLVSLVLHYFWIMPIQAALCTFFIWQEVGISSIAGVGSMILLTIPVQAFLGKMSSVIRLKTAQRTDSRVKVMNEIITGMQVIKMYAWEKPFEKVVKLARVREIQKLQWASYIKGINLSAAVFVEKTILYITILCYVLLGNTITADKVFSMAQFFNLLQLTMAIFYPFAIALAAETLISIKRLQEFLMMEELESLSIEQGDKGEIIFKDLEATWTPEFSLLKNINMHIRPGTLCAIVGPVGAGKSSVLQLLLGELIPKSGRISCGGEISYSSQEPWLFVSTVRKNITFGQEYDRERYKAVVKVCALQPDFKQFPESDKTLVGERGVSLSGGQKARINLARAVYREADIYLLDDPLSAVDTHVGKHLFEECIVNYLSGKTRILVTHQLQYLKKADHIIVLNEGKIEAQGTFEELTNSELDYTKMLVAADETNENETEKKIDRKVSTMSHVSIRSDAAEGDKFVQTEEEILKESGSVYWKYARAGGNLCILIMLASVLLLGQVSSSGADYWVTFWTNEEAERTSIDENCKESTKASEIINWKPIDLVYNNSMDSLFYNTFHSDNLNYLTLKSSEPCDTSGLLSTDTMLYIYTGLIIACIIITTLRSIIFFVIAMNASKNLHSKMFHSLLQAPMRFFDTNPSGRILNRFSRDMGAIDEILPKSIIEAVQIFLVMIGILVNVSIANYYMVIAAVILGIVFMVIRKWYVDTARDIKHLEGITKSPVFSHLTATLNGITTIRATHIQGVLKDEFDSHQDTHTSSWYLILTCVTAFGLWLDFICVIFVAAVIFSFILMSNSGTVNGSNVGLAVSQSLILTGMLQYGMRQTAEVVSQMTCVERVLEYTKLDKEGPFETPEDKKPEKQWPNKGRISFKNLYLKYSPEDPPVLKNLNIEVYPGEKVGIVGRTGAGKSSLISALFRLTALEGSIIIDDVDTNTIGLNELRRSISIIPQEPVLFTTTMRYNLDPFEEFKDDEIWQALEIVELKESVPSLDFLVLEEGSNFSVGQRQLICLARAILRNNKILVLDEATANVDPRTDALIQATIREKFATCTVLTIAHRLNTIMDSDKVLVMDAGTSKEFDHPHILLKNSEGYFSKMVAQTGPTMTTQLHEVAARAYSQKKDV